ncbi:MAG: hypothetical protein HWQ38_20910 [Nostoc sp. NMS7]|nr:hypothetical protein [Nostoc sp. NMS7]
MTKNSTHKGMEFFILGIESNQAIAIDNTIEKFKNPRVFVHQNLCE